MNLETKITDDRVKINPIITEIADVRVKINKILDDLYDNKINEYPSDFEKLNKRDILLTKTLRNKFGEDAGKIIWDICKNRENDIREDL